MDFSYLIVVLKDNLELRFRLLNTPVAQRWAELMKKKDAWPLDHPDRFYGFNSMEQEQQRALAQIQLCVDTINSYCPVIERTLSDIGDQDTLNYLHNIFERYHGLLDQQTHDFWTQAPDAVKKALAELNLAVHRCESTQGRNRPRIVCTWFGMPKTNIIPQEYFYQYGHLCPPFGSVCLNYVEIGKTLEDLAHDNDKYISDEAFKPFNYYSADFVIRFFEESLDEISKKLKSMKQYYLSHQDFFQSRGITEFNDSKLLPFRLPVAQLVETMSREELLHQIQQQQYVKQVHLE